jgi:hypothetical protein
MRNTALNKGIVDKIRRVKRGTGEFRAISERLQGKASPELIDKSRKALAALDSTLPAKSMLYKMDHGMEGMVEDSPSVGISREAHLVRRMGGADEISRSAQAATAAVLDFERSLNEETSTARVIRSKIRSRDESRWGRMLSAVRKVASAVAVTATGVASYLYMSYGLSQAADSITVAGAALASSVVLGLGIKACRSAPPKQSIPEADELRRDVLPQLRRALDSL